LALTGLALAVGLSVVAAPPAVHEAAAQSQTPEQEVDRAEQRRDAERAAARASEIAITTLSDPNCPETVSYADILGSPDDVQLNVCYALTQIDAGNVTGAAATLERILILAPQAANVRYLYAVVLFRLDNINEAEREFQTLGEQELPPEVEERIDGYLDRIAQRRERTRHAGRVSIGAYYDTNRNSAPQSDELVAAGARAPIALASNRTNDSLGLLTIIGYDLTHDPQLQNPHELFLGADLYADSTTELRDLDVHSFDFDAGIRLRYPNLTVTPRFFLRNMRLGWAKFYQSEGFELRVDTKHQLTGLPEAPPLDVWAAFRAQDEDYHNTPAFQALTLRSGKKWDTRIGLGMQLHPQHYVSLVGQAEFKSAAPDAVNNGGVRVYSYKYYNAEASHTWVLENRHFLSSSLMLGARQYKASDTLIVGNTGQRRIEQPFRARVTYGMPLTDLIGDAWLDRSVNSNDGILSFANGATVAFTGELFYQRSNITNFQYLNRRAQVMVTRPFTF
jgi:hypothetical protein